MNKNWIILGLSLFLCLYSQEEVINSVAGGWCSAQKAALIMDVIAAEKPKVAVEIGVYDGSSFIPAAVAMQNNHSGTIYAIDSWSTAEAVKNLSVGDPVRTWLETIDMSANAIVFLDRLNAWKLQNYKILPESSKTASKRFQEIDFIHFDGNFSRESVLQDLNLYFPKVKKGGMILLSNANQVCDNLFTKVDALLFLMENCETIQVLDQGNTYLFRKLEKNHE